MMMIKLDIDQKRIPWKRMGAVKNICGLRFDFAKSSIHRTHKGFHIRLALLGNHSDAEVCFLQCALGSDFHREALNWMRVKRGEKSWNVLFKMKFRTKTLWGKPIKLSEEVELDRRILQRNLTKGVYDSDIKGERKVLPLPKV
jgi:hypothetical protein